MGWKNFGNKKVHFVKKIMEILFFKILTINFWHDGSKLVKYQLLKETCKSEGQVNNIFMNKKLKIFENMRFCGTPNIKDANILH